eukprot:CAMPEP_0119543990 /NCGR_PEP_ID=MMETSP1344-20130328/54471_1 /TAXON_ID=236787 /ORGANISM="Florenciella parvula, Strain CCMP2471" /LENGTH=44 /DNA_ID= /DNA_START= /DNA_END= /DNA_ORIENTATION=
MRGGCRCRHHISHHADAAVGPDAVGAPELQEHKRVYEAVGYATT